MAGNKHSCTCKDCQAACMNKPGWFRQGEAEKAAAGMGIPLQEFFDKYLMIDYMYDRNGLGRNVFVLSPNTIDHKPGTEIHGLSLGQCVFFTAEGRCSIHENKPFECREAHCGPGGHSLPAHLYCAHNWNTTEGQKQIEELYGKKPQTEAELMKDASLPDLIKSLINILGSTIARDKRINDHESNITTATVGTTGGHRSKEIRNEITKNKLQGESADSFQPEREKS